MDTVYLQITSGRGPIECCRIVVLVAHEILSDAARQGLNAEIFDYKNSLADGSWSSAIIRLDGEGTSDFARRWCGTIQWTAQSIYRPNHGRKNWFVGVALITLPSDSNLDESEIRYETFRASGPGGQHVNKTESAVRATHIPTGISVAASDRRSQLQNKKIARERLAMKLALIQQVETMRNERCNWNNHNTLMRGNPVKTFRKPMK